MSVPVSQAILPSRGGRRPMWSGVRPGHHFSKASETGAKLKAAEAALEVALNMGVHGRLGAEMLGLPANMRDK